jgi:hypothetical protein
LESATVYPQSQQLGKPTVSGLANRKISVC